MNERIKELARQSQKVIGHTVGRSYEITELDQEKFAKLIIKECVETLGTFESEFSHEKQMYLLKQHFGVEDEI